MLLSDRISGIVRVKIEVELLACVGTGQMRAILWTVALIAAVLFSVSLLSYYWLHWLAR